MKEGIKRIYSVIIVSLIVAFSILWLGRLVLNTFIASWGIEIESIFTFQRIVLVGLGSSLILLWITSLSMARKLMIFLVTITVFFTSVVSVNVLGVLSDRIFFCTRAKVLDNLVVKLRNCPSLVSFNTNSFDSQNWINGECVAFSTSAIDTSVCLGCEFYTTAFKRIGVDSVDFFSITDMMRAEHLLRCESNDLLIQFYFHPGYNVGSEDYKAFCSLSALPEWRRKNILDSLDLIPLNEDWALMTVPVIRTF